MEASIVDLRYKMKNVLQSLERNESVRILYHKAWIGTIVPRRLRKGLKKIKDHPFFGMHSNEQETVDEQMERLRGERYK
jgi:hypothetical protein